MGDPVSEFRRSGRMIFTQKISSLLIRAALIILGITCVSMIPWLCSYQDSNGWASPNLFSLGNKPQNLSDQGRGAKLFARYCVQCHPLPSPSAHTAADWPLVADRMFRIMSGMAGHTTNIAIPSLVEQQSIIDYLKAIPRNPYHEEASVKS